MAAPLGGQTVASTARTAPRSGAGTLESLLEEIETVEGFRRALDGERASGRTVGLVPTMGALHDGHLSLVTRAASECDVVAVTVFVNPLQFGPAEDLATYPRDLDGDRRKAAAAGAAYLFAPARAEMLPAGMVTSVVVADVTEGMEGKARPGHFSGVATIVSKLFAVAGPCRAYFGEKDHQQALVVGRLVEDLSFPVELVVCPTVRAPDGLALSSRNARLTPAERAAAPVLYRALVAGAEAGPAEAERAGAAVVAREPLARLDYLEAVAEDGGWRLYGAIWVGATRLIDNLAVGAR